MTTWATISTAQNLVPNSSFEIYSSCPNGSIWPNEINKATPWHNPTTSSPDYFDTCSNSSFGVPLNAYGYHYPNTGGAYAGLFCFSYDHSSTRDYIQVQLTDSLQAGLQYCISFFLVPAIGSSNKIAITRMGILFTANAISSSNHSYFNYTPQVESPIGFYITDTLNWTQVTGNFTAAGGERFVTIGNFRTDANTDTISIVYGSGFSKQAYYYIDDISIVNCATGVAKITFDEKATIYPNPTSDQSTLHFDNTKKEICTLTLYNQCGQIMRTINNITSDQVVIQKNDLTNGLYYFVLRTSDRVIVTGKLAVD